MTLSSISNLSTNRIVVVDILRGFALIGVLFANFTAYSDQQVPTEILDSVSTKVDKGLMAFNSVFIEYKFVTLFSVLFGYGFGLFLESAEKRLTDSKVFFVRRMMSLLLIGCIHLLFWWFDILHVYAICGMFLLAFRKTSLSTIVITAIVLIIIIPTAYSFITSGRPEPLNSKEWQHLYLDFKGGDLITLFKANANGYLRLFILSGSNLYYFAETLGKMLLGYALFRAEFFSSIELKKVTLVRALYVCAPISLIYLVSLSYLRYNIQELSGYYFEPFLKIGILSTSCVYASLLVLAFIAHPENKLFNILQSLGRMTLTNYLLISLVMILLLYGIGGGLLGVIQMHTIWLIGVAWLIIEIILSSFWLKRFKNGPVEAVWRRLTWGRH